MDANIRNVDDLRAFAGYLRSLAGSLLEEFSRARQTMYAVNEGWQDIENQRFMEEFEQSVDAINHISEHMELYSDFINRKCDIVEQYLNTRL